MSTKKHLLKFLLVVFIAFIFNIGILYYMGSGKALEFLGGYIIELSLSVDNLFLFLLIFSSFRISANYQKRVLSYGIFGAIILRFIFVILGIAVMISFIIFEKGILKVFKEANNYIEQNKMEPVISTFSGSLLLSVWAWLIMYYGPVGVPAFIYNGF